MPIVYAHVRLWCAVRVPANSCLRYLSTAGPILLLRKQSCGDARSQRFGCGFQVGSQLTGCNALCGNIIARSVGIFRRPAHLCNSLVELPCAALRSYTVRYGLQSDSMGDADRDRGCVRPCGQQRLVRIEKGR